MNRFPRVLCGRRTLQVACIMLVFAISILIAPFPNPNVSGQDILPAYAPDRSKSATDIPSAPSPADRVVVTLVTEEVLGQLADGVTYTFWTFNGTVPGPFIRLREGQVVEIHIKNLANSTMVHSIDSHAVLGTGGGSVYSQTSPGNESIFQFTAMRTGLFMYHCATAPIPAHSQWHVRANPRRTERRTAQSRSRILRCAGRSLHSRPAWTTRISALQLPESTSRDARICGVQRQSWISYRKPDAEGQRWRYYSNILLKCGAKSGFILPRDRRNTRQGVRRRIAPLSSTTEHPDHSSPSRGSRHG